MYALQEGLVIAGAVFVLSTVLFIPVILTVIVRAGVGALASKIGGLFSDRTIRLPADTLPIPATTVEDALEG